MTQSHKEIAKQSLNSIDTDKNPVCWYPGLTVHQYVFMKALIFQLNYKIIFFRAPAGAVCCGLYLTTKLQRMVTL